MAKFAQDGVITSDEVIKSGFSPSELLQIQDAHLDNAWGKEPQKKVKELIANTASKNSKYIIGDNPNVSDHDPDLAIQYDGKVPSQESIDRDLREVDDIKGRIIKMTDSLNEYLHGTGDHDRRLVDKSAVQSEMYRLTQVMKHFQDQAKKAQAERDKTLAERVQQNQEHIVASPSDINKEFWDGMARAGKDFIHDWVPKILQDPGKNFRPVAEALSNGNISPDELIPVLAKAGIGYADISNYLPPKVANSIQAEYERVGREAAKLPGGNAVGGTVNKGVAAYHKALGH
jgi:hypothetical protein